MVDTVTYNPSAPWPDVDTTIAPNAGRDLSCVLDLRDDMGEATGRQLLGEALARRLVTTPGTLLGFPDYGFDLTGLVNADVTARDLAEVNQYVRDQLVADDRVLDAQVTVTFLAGLLVVQAQIFDKIGPFALTIGIDAVTIALLKVA